MPLITPEIRSRTIRYGAFVVAGAALSLSIEHGIFGDDGQPKQVPAGKEIATESVLEPGTPAYNHMRGGFHCGNLVSRESVTIRLVTEPEGGVPPTRAEVTAVDGQLETNTVNGAGCDPDHLWVPLANLPGADPTQDSHAK